ncbi:phosphopantetheine-binding protein [Paenibacillus sp. FSL R5-0490]|uniref:phosphopantetheine-binding protein n=2 Tax=unclassified Paenibacillus TaxID=185978 RepID=UPI0030D55F54
MLLNKIYGAISMEIENKLKTIFHNMGIYIDQEDYTEELELESLQFVALIIAIEKEFMVRINDDILEVKELANFKDYVNLVEKLYE